MIKRLDVYFNKKIIGHLAQDSHGEISFTYSSDWLNDPSAIRISCSLPLQKEPFKKKQCEPFFNGILPEDNQRKLIARNLGISANNDFSMLEKIGGECAGALSFIPANEKLNSVQTYYELTNKEFSNILRELHNRPLLAGKNGIRLSLAGVQDKLAIYIENNKIYIPKDSAASSHILKPNFTIFDGLIFNEAFCLKLAKQIGLKVAECSIQKIEDIYYLLIKRYDRIIGSESHQEIKRLHQEDFCQALGILAKNKYQNEGGPSIKQCFELIRKESFVPIIDLEKMISAVIFNFLIGNCDAHGKNFSFLYADQLQLSPLYDLVCTLSYEELDKKMAMKIGGEYNINKIKISHFYKLADDIGFAKPEVRKLILEIIDKILNSLALLEIQHPIQEKIQKLIKIRCQDFAVHIKENVG